MEAKDKRHSAFYPCGVWFITDDGSIEGVLTSERVTGLVKMTENKFTHLRPPVSAGEVLGDAICGRHGMLGLLLTCS